MIMLLYDFAENPFDSHYRAFAPGPSRNYASVCKLWLAPGKVLVHHH